MIEYVPGLAKVPAAESSISFIDGQEGILEYRGIRIEQLADQSTFEEVAYLPPGHAVQVRAGDLRYRIACAEGVAGGEEHRQRQQQGPDPDEEAFEDFSSEHAHGRLAASST